MKVFKTKIEKEFFMWADRRMNDFWDDSPVSDCVYAMCEKEDIAEETADWLINVFKTQDALQAGIPLSVIRGKTKLTGKKEVHDKCILSPTRKCSDCGLLISDNEGKELKGAAGDFFCFDCINQLPDFMKE